jgi:hypothetical protein
MYGKVLPAHVVSYAVDFFENINHFPHKGNEIKKLLGEKQHYE